MARGYLILTVNELTYSAPAELCDRSVVEGVQRLAGRHGYEVRFAHRRSFAEREEWPLTAFAYTSWRKDGRGRTGSQAYSFPCRPIACPTCKGRGSRGLDPMTSKACYRCVGTGRLYGRRDLPRPSASKTSP